MLHAHQAVTPRFSNVFELYPDGSSRQSSLPLWQENAPFTSAEITFTLTLPSLRSPRVFTVNAHDAADDIVVNGRVVPYREGSRLDLRPFLHTGANDVSVRLQSDASFLIFGLEPSFITGVRVGYFTVLLLILSLWLAILFLIGVFPRLTRTAYGILFLGVVLATLYSTATPAYLRSYDWWGHMAYVDHLQDERTIPRAGTSWQAHQPPLAYLPYAAASSLGRHAGLDAPHTLLLLQILSLAEVVLMFAIGVCFLFSFISPRRVALLASALFVSSPLLLSLSSQVSNDVLLTLFGVLWCTQILRLRRDASIVSLILLGLTVGFGLLTKFNAVVWLAITLVTLPFLSSSRKHGVRSLLALLVPALLLAGPYTVWRASVGDTAPVANVLHQRDVPVLSFRAAEILTFNPVDLLKNSYVDLSHDDRGRFFLESLLRRSLILSPLQKTEGAYLIILALLLLPLAVWGVVKQCSRSGDRLPVVIILLSLLSLLIFRSVYPYASTQHARYIAFAILPASMLLSRAAASVRYRFLRVLAEVTLALFVLVSALSAVSLSVV